MKKFMSVVALVMACGYATAAIKCDLSVVEKGKRIEAHCALSGIADCPTTGSVTVEWTSPDKWFGNSTYEAKWRSCTHDDGLTNTWAYRTVDMKDTDGKHRRAVGVWKVRIMSGETVLAEGQIEVK